MPRLGGTCVALALSVFLENRAVYFLNSDMAGYWPLLFFLIPFLMIPSALCRFWLGWVIAPSLSRYCRPKLSIALLLSFTFWVAAFLGTFRLSGVQDFRFSDSLSGMLVYVPVAVASGTISCCIWSIWLSESLPRTRPYRWIAVMTFAAFCCLLSFVFYCAAVDSWDLLAGSLAGNSFFASYPIAFVCASGIWTFIGSVALRKLDYRLTTAVFESQQENSKPLALHR